MTKTELVKDMMDRAQLSRGAVIQFLQQLEASVVKGLQEDGVAVVWDIARITVKEVPARPAGEYPGFGGEVTYREAKPASKKLRVVAPKGLKEQVL